MEADERHEADAQCKDDDDRTDGTDDIGQLHQSQHDRKDAESGHEDTAGIGRNAYEFRSNGSCSGNHDRDD